MSLFQKNLFGKMACAGRSSFFLHIGGFFFFGSIVLDPAIRLDAVVNATRDVGGTYFCDTRGESGGCSEVRVAGRNLPASDGVCVIATSTGQSQSEFVFATNEEGLCR